MLIIEKIPPWSVRGKSFNSLSEVQGILDLFEFVKCLQVIFDRNKIFWYWNMPKNEVFQSPIVSCVAYLYQTNGSSNWQCFKIVSTLGQKKYRKHHPTNNISISINPLYVLENSYIKCTALRLLICNADWK